jgi:hypothetical protein
MQAEAQAEHRWLEKLVGEWTYEEEASMAPGEAPHRSGGKERVRSLGGLWIVAEREGRMPDGSPALTLMTVGFDPAKGRFVGTFIGSMMTMLWLYDGTLDPGGKVLTLASEGPSFDGTGTASYHDIVEIVSDDERLFRSRVQGKDAAWNEFMIARYRRARA